MTKLKVKLSKSKQCGVNLKLHAAQLVHDVTHVFTDDRPRDLIVTLSGRLHRVPRHVIEPNYITHHTDRFVERTLPAASKT